MLRIGALLKVLVKLISCDNNAAFKKENFLDLKKISLSHCSETNILDLQHFMILSFIALKSNKNRFSKQMLFFPND